MSESEVTQIRDEDVLRRMWQQTEDFGRKKEIRAHMYKLREERLRDLYSPEPAHQAKGCEFSAAHARGHGQSFADQTFQSMKSKEVRDASSPPKEYSYRGQDLKDLSNAGWNVESEDRTADDGRTHVKFVNANIEGRYDVEGGQGQFAAVDRQRRAVTEHQDANSSLRRDETSSDTAAHEHVARQTDDGTRISSTTSSSNTSSKFQQVSSTTQKVPLEDDYDLRRSHDTNSNERVTKITNNDYEQNLRTNDSSTLRKNNSSTAELVSRKVEYPDDNTKVIVETRLMPDGTRVTSTRREFRVPAQSTRSEFQSSQSKSYSSQHKSDYRDSTSNTRHTIENRSNDIVDSQRNVDDHDFKRQLREYTSNDNDDCSTKQHHVSRTTRKVTDHSHTNDELSQKRYETRVNSKVIDQHQSTTNRDDHTQTQRRMVDVDQSTTNRDDHTQTQRRIVDIDQSTTNRDDHTKTQRRTVDVDQSTTKRDDHTQTQRRIVDVDQSTTNINDQTQHTIVDHQNDHLIDRTDRHHTTTTRDHNIQQNIVKETRHVKDSEEKVNKISTVKKDNEEIIRHVSRDRTVPNNEDHESPRDRSIPVDRVHGIPKNSTPTTKKTPEIPCDRTVPIDEARNTPRSESITVERFHDTPRDGIVPEDRPRDTSKDRTATYEKVHPIKRDTKVEEVIERKTSSDHYQTTYQNDFQSRKVSTDWSPTHQAWASTLRSDTPSTTRPSTRASSPGSKTFKSSTSSLRSSLSPDKSYKKPSSRGGSPNKMDRFSPTRTVTSDRYSSTHSTHSVTEERINKNTSPERKPPTGRSPTRPGYSPDRKPQDNYRQRPSVSPEKSPKNFSDRPNSSPVRKLTDKGPRTTSPLSKKEDSKSAKGPTQVPEKRPAYQPSDENPSDSYPKTSPYRSTSSPERKQFDHPDRSSPRYSPSPDRRPGYQKPTDSPAAGHNRISSPSRPSYPTNDSPRKSGLSPDRKLGSQQPSTQPKQEPDKSGDKYPQDSLIKRSSTSPDRKPSYMKPTASSQPDEKTKKPSKPVNDPDRRSPSKQVPTQIPDQKPIDFNKTTKIKEDHYRFVDEETKVHYTHIDRTNIDNKVVKTSTVDDSHPRDKSPSSVSHVPDEDSPDYCKAPKICESPFNKDKSPTKDTVTINENDELYGRVDKLKTINITSKHDKQIDDNTTTKRINKNKEHPEVRDAPSRETSPSKYGTYDKKKLRKEVDTTVVSTITSEDTKDVKHDSMTRRYNTSPEKVVDVPTFPSKKSPRNSISPMKSPTKDTNYKHTTDFIATERSTEEVNKATSTKDHPRQLVTPSSSPTRKPKITETEPSTGQSSPTTSVSGFIYFGSPRTEKPVVTDLDEFYPDSEIPEEPAKRPESLDVKRSPSPSKIPCRSPSPEKQVPTTKDNLPRKSSLKKPSTEFNQTSPVEKPPTSFRVSPTDDKPDVVGHKVVKKGQTSEPETGEPITVTDVTKSSKKPKPPLQRRETYDDRCKKMLGLVDDTTETITKETRKYTGKTDSSQNSPSVSPCESPAPIESLPFSNYPATKKTTKIDVVDFITHEREDLSKTTMTHDQIKTETPSRDSSPTKLQNIKTKTTLVTDKTTKDEVEEDRVTKNVIKKYPSPRQSPEKVIYQNSPALRDSTQKRPDEYTDRKRIPSPSRPTENLPARPDVSQERKSVDKYPKDTSPIRTSPEKLSGYNKMTSTTVTSTFDVSSTSDDVKKTTTKNTKISQPSRVLESPTRETPKSTDKFPKQTGHLGTISTAKQQPEDGSPVRKTLSPERKVKSDLSSHQLEPKDISPHNSRPRETTKKVPGYTKSTTAITSKFDSHYTTEDVDETYKTRTQEQKETTTKTSSPTRQTPRTGSPTKSSQPSDSYPKRQDMSPQRKPANVSSTKLPNAKQEVPGYMKTTKTATTKSDKTTVSEDFQETTKSSKTTVEKKHTTSGSVSPNRKSTRPSERTPSPTKSSRPSDIAIDKKSGKSEPSSPVKESSTKKPEPKNTTTTSPMRPSPQKVPSYMKTTASMTMKHEQDTSEFDVTTTEVIQKTITPTPTNKKYQRDSEAPAQYTRKSTDRPSPEYLRTSTSPSRPSTYDAPKRQDTPESKTGHPSKESTTGKPSHQKGTSPTRGETPGYMKTTAAITSKFEATSTTEDIEENTSVKNVHQKYSSEIPSHECPEVNRPHTLSPSKPTVKLSRTSAISPDRKPSLKSPVKDSSFPENKRSKQTPERTLASPTEPSYTKPTASITSKYDRTIITHDTEESYTSKVCEPKSPSPKKSTSPSRQSPEREPRSTSGYLPKPEEPRQLRTPSPTKKTTTLTETNIDFIMSEREQEILNKVQKSLRKLSPERKEKLSPPSRERSPSKTTTSLQDLDITISETIQTDKLTNENLTEVVEEQTNITSKVPRPTQLKDDKPKDHKSPIKPSSRNISPNKRAPTGTGATGTSNKADKTPESPTKARSFSPKKPASHGDQPHLLQQPKTSGIKPREQIPQHLTRKPTPTTLSTTRIERITTDVNKTNGGTKQNVFTKNSSSKTTSRSILSPTGKLNEPDTKRTPYPKKDIVSTKKDAITRTASETAMKPKKTSSPQRMKSKPEIKVSDMSTKSPKSLKPTVKEPYSKLPSKPKSATSLNTSIDDDDIIIDVQQSKSSRENSPDRICPTPINFEDDVGVPRFPDEVSEPDDELVKRIHHTIHETESVVDDIVEICEDEELFVKKSDMEVITEYDDSLLSVNEKVNKFTSKTHSTRKPKDTTTKFKDTERRVHSDFIDDNLKSDECLLTVSEKVNKFAKGPKDTKSSRSPSRKITDEYDRDTVYTDDYTKLSVNDKAHLFVETAENIKTTKVKPAQKVERPDFSNVDESLKTDDCLLSVSDKVNKFVKTSEQYFTETQDVDEKETKIKQQQDKIMRQIVDDDDEETYRTKETVYTQETRTINDKPTDCPEYSSKPQKEPQHAKEPKLSQPKVKDYGSPNTKPVDRVPAVKITTLRSSEAVKKAKALFENIASTQKETTQTTKTTKLTDIGVTKKSPKTDSTTVLHPSVENVSPWVTDVYCEVDVVSHTGHLSSGTLTKPQYSYIDEKPRSSPHHPTAQSPEILRSKSPSRQSIEVTTTKTVTSRYPNATTAESPRHRPESPKQRIESPKQRTESPMQRTESPRQRTESPRQRPDSDKPDKVPGYLRPTKTSQIKEETKLEETEVSTRRGSGKFGVELRRTSVERSTISSERRRSVEHHQPCIEDIFDLDLLEQMLEKVTGYEQRRRIRAQIRVARNQSEHVFEANTYTRTTKQTTSVPKSRSPDSKVTKSPERTHKSAPQRTSSPERHNKSSPQRSVPDSTQSKELIMNGHAKEPTRTVTVTRQRPQSPEKPAQKSTLVPRTPVRQPSPDKRRTSPSKVAPKPKGNRFNEYASAYMKKIGLNESEKIKLADTKTKKTSDSKQTVKHERQQQTVQEFTTTKCFTERTSSKDVIEIVQTNGKRSPSPEQRQSPERKVQFPDLKTQIPERQAYSPERRTYSPERKVSNPERKTQSPDRKAYSPERKTHSPERLHQRTPSPDFKRPKAEAVKEKTIKTVYDIGKKIPSKPVQEEKPSWVTNRNLKKITSESKTFSSKKIENEKLKYRAPSPSKIIAKPIDVITSSYGPGPLDANGKPLFGIKALRNGGSNFQVKGTVIRQEFHSRNGGEPEGTVSVTAYSSQPEDLERLLATQGAEPPSRIHGLAAITTTKKFGGDTGNTLINAHTKEDRASLEQFTHHDRRVEHLETRYDTRTQEFSGDTSIEEITGNTREITGNTRDITGNTRIEDITGNTRRTNTKKESHQDRTDRSRKEEVTEVKRQKVEDRKEKMERREDKKTVRQSSVKSLTEKYIKSANDSGKADRSAYPKAGLILRTATMRDSVSSDDAHPAGLPRTDSEHSLCSVDDTEVTTTTERTGDGVRTTTTKTMHHHHHPSVTTHTRGSTVVTHHEPVVTTRKTVITQEPVITTRKTMVISQEPVITTKRTTVVSQEPVTHRVTQGHQGSTVTTERSFLDSSTKVSGVQDILTRMKNADIVIQEGDTTEDSEARALLNKFLGATVLMAGMQGYVAEQPEGKLTMHQETVRSTSGGGKVTSRSVHELDLDQCWDERLLKQLLDECTDYEQRRRLRARIRTLMAEQEACASAVTEALGVCATNEAARDGGDGSEARDEEEVTVTSSVRRDSSDKTVSSSTTTTNTCKVTEMSRPAPKPVSPFAKFRQLEKQNSTNSPNSPKSPQSPGSPSQPFFKFTDPALQASALTIKERLLQWCRDKTRDYENVKLENFSTSWADGLAFCALVHHFLPTAFDYSKLTPDKRRHNFTLAFKVADEKAGIYPLLDVDDMVAMRKPDWKCVFTYVQAIYRRFKDEP